ncbi:MULTISPECIES: heme exporter protein CcmD [Denitromonas]|jgi:heme exporter protein D|uniref:Heme exporter protein D n=2 Tax=Denitromonas TaxID=139331 RepID=A0A557R0J9_9RHOO|nr:MULTISPECIES: heme exporter protein CcmD [Denitromonas]TVO58678.1 heme exporter protein CcmD [Denitromonas halophila]TVO67213.1 heme exporter protein CcmD [Denitromonas ohlonensis]TVO79273.1 heme exporter protein CcmD [Denitromonas ohlonensis]TVT50951.1 MAG: heme exporter protein CcmD [Denitromonas halophila]TVT68069.1 MAG: heme exporter protein CcmD [Denitromonas halophila]
MNWQSMSDFWSMGGAGFFVWGSYGVTFALIALELVVVLRRRKQVVHRLQRLRQAMKASARRKEIQE